MWLLLLIVLAFSPANSYAQESSASAEVSTVPIVLPTPTTDPIKAIFDQYQNDYNYMYEQYKQAYLEYTQKKEVHTKYGTLTTKQDKIEATKKALIARNNAQKSYLTALRLDLDRFKQANPTDTSKYQIEIQKLENWFDEQNSVVSAYNNEDDLKIFANAFTKKYIGIQQTIYTSLALHQINQTTLNLAQIQALAQNIKTDPKINPQSTDWQGSLTIKADTVNSTLKQAFMDTQIKQSTQRFNNFYPTSKKSITRATQYLSDMLSDLKSVVIQNYQP